MKRILALTTVALLALTGCGNDTDAEAAPEPEPTTTVAPSPEETTQPVEEEPAEEDAPPMDYDSAPLPDGTLPPHEAPLGQPAYQAVMYQGDSAPVEWEATLTDLHCDVNIDQVNADFTEELLVSGPYIPRPGHTLCAATITYTNIGTVPGVTPKQPNGLISNGALYEQTADYALFIVNNILMEAKLGGPFNPGITFEAQTLIEAPEGLDVDAVYLEPDDTEVATHLLVK